MARSNEIASQVSEGRQLQQFGRTVLFAAIFVGGLEWLSLWLSDSQRDLPHIALSAGAGIGLIIIRPRRYSNVILGTVALVCFLVPFLCTMLSALECLQLAILRSAEIAFGAWLLRSQHLPRTVFISVRKFSIFVASVVFGIAGVFSIPGALWATQTFHRSFALEWQFWFVSHGLGAMVVLPLMFAWSMRERNPIRKIASKQSLEAVLLLAVTVVASYLVFIVRPDQKGNVPQLTYLCVPIWIWAAIRFGLRGATLAVTVMTALGLYGTARGLGPFNSSGRNPAQALLELQIYLAVTLNLSFFMAVIVKERGRALERSAMAIGRLNAALQTSGQAIYEYRPKQNLILWEGNVKQIFGIDRNEIRDFGSLLTRVAQADRERVATYFDGLKQNYEMSPIEYQVIRPDGATVTVRDRGRSMNLSVDDMPMAIPEDRRIIGVLDDVTELRNVAEERARLEARLSRVERTQAIGQLAGAIAHDFNNILASIKGCSELAQAKIEKAAHQTLLTQHTLRENEKRSATAHPSETGLTGPTTLQSTQPNANTRLGATQRLSIIADDGGVALGAAARADLNRYLETISKAGDRGRELVDQVFAYSRRESSQPKPVALAAIAQEVESLLRVSVPKHIELTFEMSPPIPTVMGDATRMHQLLMNLAGNAIKAIREPGHLAVRISSVYLKRAQECLFGNVGPGDFALIEVIDTGVGMTPETAHKIFEPFFTNREGGYGESTQASSGRSHGLGLAIVQSIVTEHHGAINVQTELGRGTCFSVYIPSAAITSPNENADYDNTASLGRGEIVMIVDDESGIVEVLEETLAQLGFEPIGFSNAEAALAAFEKDPARFDIIVSDEVMPGLTGTDLIARVKERCPQVIAIIASAYGGLGFETRALSAGVDRVLRKPYQRNELIAVLSQLLNRPSA